MVDGRLERTDLTGGGGTSAFTAEDNIEAATAVFNLAYEDMIRQAPEQYMWATRRFRHSPDLAEDPYRRARRRARS